MEQKDQKIRRRRQTLPDLLSFLFTLSALAACGSRTGLVTPTDGGAFPSGPDECPNSGSTFVYVISEQNELLSFYPPTASFTSIGVLTCPVADPNDSPFSMAVDRRGVAYVLFSSGTLYVARNPMDVAGNPLPSILGTLDTTAFAAHAHRDVLAARAPARAHRY